MWEPAHANNGAKTSVVAVFVVNKEDFCCILRLRYCEILPYFVVSPKTPESSIKSSRRQLHFNSDMFDVIRGSQQEQQRPSWV